jgi:hypothetical protein
MGYQQKILEHFRSALPDTTDLTEDQVWIAPAAHAKKKQHIETL